MTPTPWFSAPGKTNSPFGSSTAAPVLGADAGTANLVPTESGDASRGTAPPVQRGGRHRDHDSDAAQEPPDTGRVAEARSAHMAWVLLIDGQLRRLSRNQLLIIILALLASVLGSLWIIANGAASVADAFAVTFLSSNAGAVTGALGAGMLTAYLTIKPWRYTRRRRRQLGEKPTDLDPDRTA